MSNTRSKRNSTRPTHTPVRRTSSRQTLPLRTPKLLARFSSCSTHSRIILAPPNPNLNLFRLARHTPTLDSIASGKPARGEGRRRAEQQVHIESNARVIAAAPDGFRLVGRDTCDLRWYIATQNLARKRTTALPRWSENRVFDWPTILSVKGRSRWCACVSRQRGPIVRVCTQRGG